jgi:GNAT superfamily N-acetyltransferase
LPADAFELASLRYAFRTERRPASEAEAGFIQRCTEWMAERLASNRNWRCWVAVTEGRLVATIWLQLIEKLPNPVEETEIHGYVTSVYVAPPYRNSGLGTALLTASLAECDALGVDSVFLWSTAESRELYQRHGFAVRGDLLDRR